MSDIQEEQKINNKFARIVKEKMKDKSAIEMIVLQDEQLDKYKKVLDKIKEKLKEKDENGFEKIYVEDAIIFIDELLEEIE